jgi:hypothetical protein
MGWLTLQMLCDDRGIFLEIADFIKGLGLTILEGVMEVRESKIWARFTVEVLILDVKIRRSVAAKWKVIGRDHSIDRSINDWKNTTLCGFTSLLICHFPGWHHLTLFMQANRDVTRMEIFLSLVRLLEPNCDGAGEAENANIVNTPLGLVHQPVIPATARIQWGPAQTLDHASSKC